MIPFVSGLTTFRKQYITFLATIVLTIVTSQVVIQYDLNKQNEDARHINLAGRQRVLGQRIAKLALFIDYEFDKYGTMTPARRDTLRTLLDHWEKVHNGLMGQNKELGISDRRSQAIDSLLSVTTIHLKPIVQTLRDLLANPTPQASEEAIRIISLHELPFLQVMERTVNTYQAEAESKLRKMKYVEVALAISALIILLMEFFFLFKPMVRSIEQTNNDLSEVNSELAATNEELRASEEELRTNLDFITTLQKDVAAREKQYREVIESATDMIYELDDMGTFVFTNPVMEKITGYLSSELRSKKYWEIIQPSAVEGVKLFYKKQREDQEGQTYLEVPILSKAGQLIWVGQNVKMTYEGKRVTRVSVIAREITLKKQAEAALRDAKEKAEEATRAKSQFLSMISHEIRTPMNAVIGLTHLLLQDQPRPDQVDSLNLLKFSGENLLTIINDILDFNKIEAGKINLEHVDIDLQALLASTIQILRQRAEDKHIKLDFTYDVALPKVIKGDPVRINQIINNLVGNAIKFTENGSVQLIVSLAGKVKDDYKVRFTVKDTGIGIPADKIDTIFERFSQANEDTTRKFGGTGLGLPITRRLLQLMESDIRVESTLGLGSEFTFELTLARGQEQAAKTTNIDQHGFELLNIRILLVEDNRVNQVVVTNFLKRWGVEAAIANHGKEALQLITTKDYALVLMDLQMPEMDGYETSKRIRSMDDPYYSKVPIIALTASAMIDVKGKVIGAGMNDFISKPFQPYELYQKIATFVTNKPADELPKQLSNNLDLYSEGDPDFKRELAGHLIKNIEELIQALHQSRQTEDATLFSKTHHKVKPTITMLGDDTFIRLVDELKSDFMQRPPVVEISKVKTFEDLAERIINGLKEEINPAA
jgi:PAS domain S-box-containing protein